MGTLRISGNLVAGPPTVDTEGFPGTRLDLPLRLLEGGLSYGAATGILRQRLNSPSTFLQLHGVGTGEVVSQGLFLYLKSDQAIRVRLTFDDGLGGDEVAILSSTRLILGLQFEPTLFLKKLEARGSAVLEYFVCGAE